MIILKIITLMFILLLLFYVYRMKKIGKNLGMDFSLLNITRYTFKWFTKLSFTEACGQVKSILVSNVNTETPIIRCHITHIPGADPVPLSEVIIDFITDVVVGDWFEQSSSE